ncbi:hypothetical protein KSP39_PZI023981 [Platanthera zijinensis]|uniref:Transmembrane protein n=1 Tax=Platanthera zijinensis TaxID=2320716 RepID=A0AAP0ATX9_9ASPA
MRSGEATPTRTKSDQRSLKNKHGVEDSKRPPGTGDRHPGGVLHQRRRLPQSPILMAFGGFAAVAGMAYFMLYAKPEKGISPNQIATAAVGEKPYAPKTPSS